LSLIKQLGIPKQWKFWGNSGKFWGTQYLINNMAKTMARLARVILPGYPHHITQRGNRRQDVL